MWNGHDTSLEMVNPLFFNLIYVLVVGVHQLITTKLILLIWIIIVFIFSGKLKKKYWHKEVCSWYSSCMWEKGELSLCTGWSLKPLASRIQLSPHTHTHTQHREDIYKALSVNLKHPENFKGRFSGFFFSFGNIAFLWSSAPQVHMLEGLAFLHSATKVLQVLFLSHSE